MAHGKYASYPSLKDRVVVITGGSMGIGASMVENFSLQGSKVIFLDIADDRAVELVERLKASGVQHTPVFHHCDVTDIEGALQPTAAKILAEYPRIHALINSACSVKGRATVDITPEIWDRDIKANLTHYFFLTQALLPGLLAAAKEEGETSIVNLGSITWAIPATRVAAYTTSKAGIMGLTRTWAHEFGPQGIRVNSIMPGSTATEHELNVVMTPEYREKVLGAQAIKRLIVPAEIARAALWLVSDDSSGMTNQSIHVDGGWT